MGSSSPPEGTTSRNTEKKVDTRRTTSRARQHDTTRRHIEPRSSSSSSPSIESSVLSTSSSSLSSSSRSRKNLRGAAGGQQHRASPTSRIEKTEGTSEVVPKISNRAGGTTGPSSTRAGNTKNILSHRSRSRTRSSRTVETTARAAAVPRVGGEDKKRNTSPGASKDDDEDEREEDGDAIMSSSSSSGAAPTAGKKTTNDVPNTAGRRTLQELKQASPPFFHPEAVTSWRKISKSSSSKSGENSIDSIYSIGGSLLPDSDDSDKYCKSALRRSDKTEVVLKGRHKLRGFKDEEELEDWKVSMALMHYVTNNNGSSGSSSSTSTSAGGAKTSGDKRIAQNNPLPNIAQISELLEDEKWYYAVMEKVHGRDMFDFFIEEKLAKTDDLNLIHKIALNFIRQVCNALHALHSKGIVHRDLKFENIVVVENGGSCHNGSSSPKRASPVFDPARMEVKLIDFDTAEIFDANRIYYHVLGTDQYIAPEVYAGMVTPACDMWAVGVMLYTLFTGTLPFHNAIFDDEPGENWVGNPAMEKIRRRLKLVKIDWSHPVWSEKRPSSQSIVQPESLVKDFCRRCFAFEPSQRLTVVEALAHPWLSGK
ncbi:unnamed protein product [Amoebophrya sp. A120]|nr:unnamed protein product [Amoebophrya sp. A120]|eukprot:GSA120T00013169001.1